MVARAAVARHGVAPARHRPVAFGHARLRRPRPCVGARHLRLDGRPRRQSNLDGRGPPPRHPIPPFPAPPRPRHAGPCRRSGHAGNLFRSRPRQFGGGHPRLPAFFHRPAPVPSPRLRPACPQPGRPRRGRNRLRRLQPHHRSRSRRRSSRQPPHPPGPRFARQLRPPQDRPAPLHRRPRTVGNLRFGAQL